MGYYLPTYEDCVNICKVPNSPFYEKKDMVNGYNVSLFNYSSLSYVDFSMVIDGGRKINAAELRGLTFVFNEDGTVFNRFLLLHKFFNLNQIDSYQYDVVKNFKIKDVHYKEDGSVVSFIQLPDGTIVGKSKMGLSSVQSYATSKIYNTNNDIRNFVNWTIDNNLVAIFEYVGPSNKIVLSYDKEELILLRVRDNLTGRYLDLSEYSNQLGHIRTPLILTHTLDELLDIRETIEDIEGWVIHCITDSGDDFFFKLKTKWYFDAHNLYEDDIHKENVIVRHIFEGNIDDIVSQIPQDKIKLLDMIENVTCIVNQKVQNDIKEVRKLYNLYIDSDRNIREFSIKNNKSPFFKHVMLMVKKDYSESDAVIYLMAKKYTKLEETKNWLYGK